MNGMAGHAAACIQAMASRPGTDVMVFTKALPPNHEFSPEHVTPRGASMRVYEAIPPGRRLLREVRAFRPDVVAIVGWQIVPYRYVARHLRPRPLRVLCMDNQWLGTAKQLLGVLTRSVYLHPLFDAVFLPGDRQASFARKLGFRDDQIWRGFYSCEHARFSAQNGPRPSASSFLFVGRLVQEKGVDTLAAAYRMYRSGTERPWPLVVCGTGPLEPHFSGIPGVEVRGFVQPGDLPALFWDAGCLVVPSVFEPWGVVIHEAAAAALPVICTTVCGAVPHLVEDGYNGFLVAPEDPVSLSKALRRYSSLEGAQRAAMGEASRMLSFRFTPERWADTFLTRSAEAISAR